MQLLSKNNKIIALVYAGDDIDYDMQETFEIRIPIYTEYDKTGKIIPLRKLVFFSFDNEELKDFYCSELTQDGFRDKEPIWKTTKGERLIYNPVRFGFEIV